MALLTHQLQGSFTTFTSRPLSWTKGIKLKHRVETLHMVGRTNRSCLLKRNCLSVEAPRVRGLKGKPIKISAFKGSVQSDESGGRTSGSKSTKNQVQSVSLPHTSNEREGIEGTSAVHNLFKKWLTMLRTQSDQVEDEILGEGPLPRELSDTQNGTHKKERVEIHRAIWSYFLGLDATIKMPLLIFIPCFLAVNLLYGAQVSKELMPLWIFGPLIVALYVKMLRGIIALYVFSFKQTVKVIKNVPTYYISAYTYIAHGNLKDDLKARFWQPVVNMRNIDYKETSKGNLKKLEEWLYERYLDFIEYVWPYYSRLIRFLKRANFM